MHGQTVHIDEKQTEQRYVHVPSATRDGREHYSIQSFRVIFFLENPKQDTLYLQMVIHK